MKRERVCADCRATIPAPPPGHVGGTGYARTPGGRTICYACCAKRDTRRMIRHGKADLYLVAPRGPLSGRWTVSNWPGTLTFPIRAVREGRHATFGGFKRRLDAWFVGPDGFIWHAVVRGDMDLARCKRTRERAS